MLLCKIVDYIHGLCGGKEAYARTIAEEAKIAVIGYDVDRGIPRRLHGRGSAGADVVHGGYVAPVEADARAEAEHFSVGRIGRA